jgi:glycosyltransferase involved in cell wall biosynthesis
VVYQQARELLRRGHQVTIYCTNLLNKKQKIYPTTRKIDYEGIRVLYFNTWNIPAWPGTLGPFWLPDLPGFLARDIANYDVVHLEGYRSTMMAVVAQTAHKAGVPIVTQPQGTLPVIVSSFFLKRFYDTLIGRQELKWISALIALQEKERSDAIMQGVPAAKIEVIPNGIDASERANLPEPGCFRHSYGIDPNCPLILSIGRINKIKGTDMLVRAFAKMERLNAHLVIAGPDDGLLSEVKALIKALKIGDQVTLAGLISDQDKLAAFVDADLFVLPSRSDAFPTTIMEACMVGTPMVITDCCASAYLVKDRIADVTPFDADAFASAMGWLLTDEERYTRYRHNCQEMLNGTFSIEAVVDRLEAVYRRLAVEKA